MTSPTHDSNGKRNLRVNIRRVVTNDGVLPVAEMLSFLFVLFSVVVFVKIIQVTSEGGENAERIIFVFFLTSYIIWIAVYLLSMS